MSNTSGQFEVAETRPGMSSHTSPDVYDPEMKVHPSPSATGDDNSNEDLVSAKYEAIKKMLSDLIVSPELLTNIAVFLLRIFSVKDIPIINLRATVVVDLTGDGKPWLIVDWLEGEDKVLALFEVDVDDATYNCLMHVGVGTPQLDGRPWSRSRISWYVLNIEGLKSLLIGAQHLFDMVHWRDPGLVGLFSDPTQTNASEEE
jgi:hypothetical protein